MDDDTIIYKLAPTAEVDSDAWARRGEWMTFYKGTQTTNYIACHAKEALAGVAEASFAGRTDLMVLSFKAYHMQEEADLKIKIEAGEYQVTGGFIPYACLFCAPHLLTLDSDGKHVFPHLGPVSQGDAHVGVQDVDSDVSDDGMEAFDQHRFDEDD